ncbi:hypothetical protein [Paenibacillus apiarius]|uniref:hypothetical protein n=1 Tax=Paenibacillus apiarius TaxID=46240 RepID=UPI0015956CD1|nr:hypothetical protein [Paenibacillus apiarius]MCY9558230.1 hypothetical protein [Paenibacillus apiarius]MCY9684630.1 hypothetical protein [Paenibacillus apiarius]MCY9728451.1 hypothetical protein [Paenibacillus apiarius]MCY9793237.1 hypothetical protein [Paenibacillus apiarius]MEC0120271.1 hypothetical protein [Paenibacillus apiarius]
MKVATKVAIATLSSVLLLGSSVNFAAEAQSSLKNPKNRCYKNSPKGSDFREKKVYRK